jgi:hypothetical protein
MNKLALITYELVNFGTYRGLPLEQAEYKELVDFFKELWEYLLELAQKACDALVRGLKMLNMQWNGESWVVVE